MKDSVYLIADRKGIRRMSKRRPPLKQGEIATKITVIIGSKFWARMFPEATVTVPDDHIIVPEVEVASDDD